MLPSTGIFTRASIFVLVLLTAVSTAHAADARNAAYFELGGSGILPSVNFERRLNQRWTGRAGFSSITGETSGDSQTTFIVPLTMSRLTAPQGNHHFEAGGGVTFAFGDRQDLFNSSSGNEKFSTAFVTGIVGYRYQKPAGGFQFRAALTPVAGAGEITPWFGLSFGYAW